MRTRAKISHSPSRRSRAAPARNIEIEESVIERLGQSLIEPLRMSNHQSNPNGILVAFVTRRVIPAKKADGG
jgi:hypothetical protein